MRPTWFVIESLAGFCRSLRCRCRSWNGSVDNILLVIKNSSLVEPRTPRLVAVLLNFFRHTTVLVMSGYTSSYRPYESKKLANGSLKVNEDKRVVNGICEDDCYVVKVEWNYRLEVSEGWECFTLQHKMCI